MSKRRISKQQATRIKKMQADYRQNMDADVQGVKEEGLVIARFSRHAEIENNQGQRIHCSIRPHLDSLVAGDKVIWQAEGDKQGVVISHYPRHSVLFRANQRKTQKPIAANITQILIVSAPKPELTWSLLDSYLIMAEELQLSVCIVLNKIDLPCETITTQLLSIYQPLGYPVLFTSKESELGYEALRKQLDNQVSVFVGQSGVGKSSLIANLLPDEKLIAIGDISLSSEHGRHTTSHSRFYHLPSGGGLIDSPGIRELSLWHLPASAIAKGFREFRPLIPHCKFRNCKHYQSPGCAILAALAEGKIAHERYESFLKICLP